MVNSVFCPSILSCCNLASINLGKALGQIRLKILMTSMDASITMSLKMRYAYTIVNYCTQNLITVFFHPPILIITCIGKDIEHKKSWLAIYSKGYLRKWYVILPFIKTECVFTHCKLNSFFFFCNMTYFYPNQYCKVSHITTLNTFAYLANHAPMSVESFGPSARYMIPPRNMDIPWPMAAIALIHVLSA